MTLLEQFCKETKTKLTSGNMSGDAVAYVNWLESLLSSKEALIKAQEELINHCREYIESSDEFFNAHGLTAKQEFFSKATELRTKIKSLKGEGK